ncbi:hypothetical protein SAMN04487995_3078 [Dyadobacter koreensis]|uniref:ACT domain-containing protein n=1 Tax=Dyadobacter koreensis TaxID=408657 RepID=A0A1H6VQF2_9BACT|nr:hypothetical protein [Dyadobacter koreensis]SEJ02285.1 hypothetical protein SAMN04487995_3078 [Dyadobacter koreensis]
MNTHQLNIIYPHQVNLYKITSTVESVNGARIKYLNFRLTGKDFVGTLVVETSDKSGLKAIIKRMRATKVLASVINIRC